MEYAEYLTKRMAYQEVGHLLLLERKHFCLFYKPGKGKTYPCIDAVRDIDESLHGDAKVLILSTANAIKEMWQVDIVPQNILPKHTVLLSFTTAIQEQTKLKLLKLRWDVIIIDESHKIKAHNTQISKLVHMLTKKCEYAWGLSGTPRGNSDLDIFCQFHNLNISQWGKISYTQFVNQCCDVEQQFFAGRMVPRVLGINKKYIAGWERNINLYTQRADYDDDDNMPPLKVNVVRIPYVPTLEYLKAEQGIIQLKNYETTLNKQNAINKARQIVNGFVYIPGEEIDDPRRTINIERPAKLDWLKDNLTDKPTLITYLYEGDLFNIQKDFDERGVDYTEVVNDFKAGKSKTLILQCGCGESFNLQICKHLIFYTMSYSYIDYVQMLHRIWRKGQEDEVTITILLYDKTVEDKVWLTVDNKETFAQLFYRIKGAL